MENRVIAIAAALLACLPTAVFCDSAEVLPREVIRYKGGEASFFCVGSYFIKPNILWTINGTRWEDLTNNDNIFTNSSGRISGSLTIKNLPANYDNTIIQCTITFTYNDTATTNNSTLRVQGLLDAVGELNADFFESNRSLHIFWTPPFSLINNNFDRSYCVNVVNQTSNTTISSLSSCGRRVTYFVVTDIDCVTVYEVIVTPVNPVGNGTSASVVFPDGTENCNTNLQGDMQTIEVSCNLDDMTDMYVVTLQYTNRSGSRRIVDISPNNIGYSNRPVIVEGIGDGLHCVTVFLLVNNSDIIKSTIVFRQQFNLDGIPMSIPTTAETTVAASTSTATSSGTTPSGVSQSNSMKYIIPVVVVVAILVVIILVVIICCCCYIYKKRDRTKSVANNESPSPGYADAEVVTLKKELPLYSTVDSSMPAEEKKVVQDPTSAGTPIKSTSSTLNDLWNRTGSGSCPSPHIDNDTTRVTREGK